MGALIIIPASIADNLARSTRQYVTASSALGGAISVAGVRLAMSFRFPPGPTIVLLGVGVFLLTLLVGQRRLS